MRTKILKNRAMCLLCGDIIESKHVHDFVTCACGQLSVDGGHDYFRRAFTVPENFEDMNETVEVEE